MSNMIRIQQKRKADDDKNTRFMVRGRAVARENIDRWEKRQRRDPSKGDIATAPQARKKLTVASPPSWR
jgi:hypothetical protein